MSVIGSKLILVKLRWPLGNFQKRLSEIFTINLMVRHSQQLNLYTAENWNSSQQSNREFCSFLTRTNVSFQKRSTLKVDTKQVPVLQIYN